MAKDPAFLFYPGDWLGGTIGMSFEEKGAYMELLMMQFTRGHMTKDMIGQTVGQLWVNLQDKFVQDTDGLWYNARLDIEKSKRKTYVDSRKNNKNGKNQHNKQVGHMTSHMENENENKVLIQKELFEDEIFMEQLRRDHPGKDYEKAFGECWLYHTQRGTKLHAWEWRQKLGTWLIRFEEKRNAKRHSKAF
jgi:uncharacterized protein YdaU (DUF1376 family)